MAVCQWCRYTEHAPGCPVSEAERLREEHERLRGFAEKGWTIDHLMECEEALRCAEERVAQLEAQIALMEPVLVAADRIREAYDAMLEGRNVGRLEPWATAPEATDQPAEPSRYRQWFSDWPDEDEARESVLLDEEGEAYTGKPSEHASRASDAPKCPRCGGRCGGEWDGVCRRIGTTHRSGQTRSPEEA